MHVWHLGREDAREERGESQEDQETNSHPTVSLDASGMQILADDIHSALSSSPRGSPSWGMG